VLGLIDRLKDVNLKDAIKMMDESIKLQRKILQLIIWYRQVLQQVGKTLFPRRFPKKDCALGMPHTDEKSQWKKYS